MDTFSRHKWGWGVFIFWIGYWSYLISRDGDDVTGFAHMLTFVFPWLVTIAIYVGKEIADKRSTSAFWNGYDAGRQAEKDKLAHHDLPDNVKEVR